MKLYIGNLAYQVTDADLQGLFAELGEVSEAKVITDRQTRQSRGFGFVTMENGHQAIERLDGTDFMGRALIVNEAKPQRQNDQRGSGEHRRGGDHRRDQRRR